MTATDIAVHDEPVWRSKANFIIFADVTQDAPTDRWEQLWARQLTEDTFELCCIPFFTYGFSLGDVVRTAPSKGKRFVIGEVLQKSGHSVLRLWLGQASARLDEVVLELAQRDVSFEVSGKRLVAANVQSEQRHDVAEWTARWAEPRGIQVEDG